MKHLNKHERRFEVHEKRMKHQDTLIDKFGNILVTFKVVQVEHMGWTHTPPMELPSRATFGGTGMMTLPTSLKMKTYSSFSV